MLRNIEISVGTNRQALGIAVPIGKDMALDAIYLGIVLGYGSVRIHSEHLSLICGPVFAGHLLRCRNGLGLNVQTV
jgi:hypothetical protein